MEFQRQLRARWVWKWPFAGAAGLGAANTLGSEKYRCRGFIWDRLGRAWEMEERLRDAGEAERDEDVSAPKAGLGGGRGTEETEGQTSAPTGVCFLSLGSDSKEDLTLLN